MVLNLSLSIFCFRIKDHWMTFTPNKAKNILDYYGIQIIQIEGENLMQHFKFATEMDELVAISIFGG